MKNIKDLQRALAMSGVQVPLKDLDIVMAIAEVFREKEGEFSLKDGVEILAEMELRYEKPACRYKYELIPVSFKDYNEYIDELNKIGHEGWIVKEIINRYYNSPMEGVTTYDHLCVKIKR